MQKKRLRNSWIYNTWGHELWLQDSKLTPWTQNLIPAVQKTACDFYNLISIADTHKSVSAFLPTDFYCIIIENPDPILAIRFLCDYHRKRRATSWARISVWFAHKFRRLFLSIDFCVFTTQIDVPILDDGLYCDCTENLTSDRLFRLFFRGRSLPSTPFLYAKYPIFIGQYVAFLWNCIKKHGVYSDFIGQYVVFYTNNATFWRFFWILLLIN